MKQNTAIKSPPTRPRPFYALLFDEKRDCWMAYEAPRKIIRADSAAEVIPALREVDRATNGGYTAVGYVAYEAAPGFDPALACHDSEIPPLLFALFEQGAPVTLDDRDEPPPQLSPDLSAAKFNRQLARIRKYLGEGDSYQVNFTLKLRGEVLRDTRRLFSRLIRSQPGTRSVYLEWDDFAVCSVSPELFFKLDGDRIVMEPMKGTRPRGLGFRNDLDLGTELLSSEKERAENLMIVDMIRNDLGKIADPGSVNVDALFKIVRLPTLWQQVSVVSGKTRADLAGIFSALFPCASITGAPKARTMAIIRELEPHPRGIYTGAVGYVMPGRRAQFNVAIRTLVIDRHSARGEMGVGSGIVWDSDPRDEWRETLNKARFLWQRARAGFRLLETMRYEPGSGVYLMERHLDRLSQAAEYFGFRCDLAEVAGMLRQYRSDEMQRLRLLVNAAGAVELDAVPLAPGGGPVRLALGSAPLRSDNPFLYFKTTERGAYESARPGAGEWDDIILWNERGELTETRIYNLYLEIGGELLTPALASGLLPGTYRQLLLESGEAREAVLRIEDLGRTSRLFVSNSVRGMQEALLLSG